MYRIILVTYIVLLDEVILFFTQITDQATEDNVSHHVDGFIGILMWQKFVN